MWTFTFYQKQVKTKRLLVLDAHPRGCFFSSKKKPLGWAAKRFQQLLRSSCLPQHERTIMTWMTGNLHRHLATHFGVNYKVVFIYFYLFLGPPVSHGPLESSICETPETVMMIRIGIVWFILNSVLLQVLSLHFSGEENPFFNITKL